MYQADCECPKSQGGTVILRSKHGFFLESRDSRENGFLCSEHSHHKAQTNFKVMIFWTHPLDCWH